MTAMECNTRFRLRFSDNSSKARRTFYKIYARLVNWPDYCLSQIDVPQTVCELIECVLGMNTVIVKLVNLEALLDYLNVEADLQEGVDYFYIVHALGCLPGK